MRHRRYFFADKPFSSLRSPKFKRLLSLLIVLAVLWGLGQQQVAAAAPSDSPLLCRGLFYRLDTVIDTWNVRDQGPYPIPGFPYLRMDRLLASFRDDLDSPAQIASWLHGLAALDINARHHEWQNLPQHVRGNWGENFVKRLNDCRDDLLDLDISDSERLESLKKAVRVPDEYNGSWRLLGLYPVSALLVMLGVDRWHDEARAGFNRLPENTLAMGRWQYLGGAKDSGLDQGTIAEMLSSSRDSLGIPRLKGEKLKRIFDHFAPVWKIDVVDDHDRVGQPQWLQGKIVIDTAKPTEFRHVSYTRFGDETLLQLNYIVWFSGRPGSDIYAGAIDGINWRLTLTADGHPLIYDAIHNCGCYEMFFPSPLLRVRQNLSRFYLEPPLILPVDPTSGALTVSIMHGTHYIHSVYWQGGLAEVKSMARQRYDNLRSLPEAEGYRSMFGRHGLVPGSERAERFLLWPMGVRSAGAMRQWGRHAISFVGRRHFDDPDLITSLFERQP